MSNGMCAGSSAHEEGQQQIAETMGAASVEPTSVVPTKAPGPTSPHPDHRSVSSMCRFTRCPRLYFWKKLQGLSRESVARTLGMRMGSALHAAAPWTHRLDADPAKAIKAWKAEWADGDDYADPARNSQVAKRVLYKMIETHEDVSYEIVVPSVKTVSHDGKVLEHERHVEVDLGLPSGKPVMAIVDLLVRMDGELLVLDYKSASRMYSNFAEMFQLSPQMWTYMAAMRVAGEEVTGAVVEGILVSKTKQEVQVVQLSIPDVWEELLMAWWLRHDAELAACEQRDSEAQKPEEWRCELGGCNTYALHGLQGFQCEFAPLCEAGARWRGMLDMYACSKGVSEEEEAVEG